GWRAINKLRVQQDALHQKTAEEVNFLQKNTCEKERVFGKELEELKAQLNDQISLNLKLSTELEAEREDYRPPKDRARHNNVLEEEPCTQQESVPSTPAIEPLKDHEIPEENPGEQQETVNPSQASALEEAEG
ncbi:hypothetical protein GBF38_006954, partial [Nibea albiflora]